MMDRVVNEVRVTMEAFISIYVKPLSKEYFEYVSFLEILKSGDKITEHEGPPIVAHFT